MTILMYSNQFNAKIRKLGYYPKEEMEVMLQLPNITRMCSNLENRLEKSSRMAAISSKEQEKKLEKNTPNDGTIYRHNRRIYPDKLLSSQSSGAEQVSVEFFFFNAKTAQRTLTEINNLRIIQKTGDEAKKGISRVISLKRCYYREPSGYASHSVFLVYPLVKKDALQFVLQLSKGTKTVSEHSVYQLMKDFSKGVMEMHNLDLIHRHISLSSFLIDHHGRGYLSYLYYSMSVDDPIVPSLTAGVPYYKAPEMQNDSTKYGKPADVFALCIVFVSILSQDLPQNIIKDPTFKTELFFQLEENFIKYVGLLEGMCKYDPSKRISISKVVDFLEKIKDQVSDSKMGKGRVEKGKRKPEHDRKNKRVILQMDEKGDENRQGLNEEDGVKELI